MSRRIMHFAGDKMYFECMEWAVSEDGIELLNGHGTIHPYSHPSLTSHRNTNDTAPSRRSYWHAL